MVHRVKYRFSAVLLASLFWAVNCFGEMEWAFHPSEHTNDGASAAYVTAPLDGGQLRYVLPSGWCFSGDRFLPTGKNEADAYIDAARIQSPSPWTPDRAKAVRDWIIAQKAAKKATNVACISEGELPFKIEGQSAYEFTLTYGYYGQRFTEAVVFVEHGQVQLQIHLGALKDDFAELHKEFVATLFSVNGF